MQAFTIADLLTYRKCPKAMYLQRKSGAAPALDRVPLCLDAAYALRSLASVPAEEFYIGRKARKNNAIAYADLLVRRADGWELLMDTNSLHLRETLVWEASFIMHVFAQIGLPIRKVTALLISPDYMRAGAIDWKELYIEQDITERAQTHVNAVKNLLAQMKATEMDMSAPERELFESCLKPRECPYWKVCSARLPKPNVFSIVGMSNRRKFQLYRKGVIRFEDCLKYAKLPKPQKMQVRCELENSPSLINAPALQKFLGSIWYPVRFLDFESYQPAVPPFAGMKPFTQCAFLYSVHGIDKKHGPVTHSGVFVPHGTDPRRQIAEGLCRDIPRNACVIVYSSGLEKSVVVSLAQLFPDLKEHLMKIAANMRDMLGPFRDRMYYDRRMEGSCSLKHVLPAIDETLSYEALEGVQNGEDAMHAYEKTGSMPNKQRAETERSLQEYCAMDTLSLVRILQKLEAVVQG